jgi:hypothetical protein
MHGDGRGGVYYEHKIRDSERHAEPPWGEFPEKDSWEKLCFGYGPRSVEVAAAGVKKE